MMIFKTPKGTRTSWSDVPVEDWYHFSRFVANGCGGSSIQNKYLDKYLFGKQKRASCIIHDWYFAVGGNIYDFIRANFTMFGKQVEDAMELRSFSMFFASFLYLIATSTLGAFYFNWGDYRSVKEVIYNIE